jgi:NAD-dependent dihydropyrimidine dehydrogenase PreA subunit
MAIREMVTIDEEKCDGCGLCVPSCAEGAIQIIDGKARLVADNLCDGLGACLGDCPQGAITIEKRAAAEFDEEAVARRLQEIGREPLSHSPSPVPSAQGGGCPSAQVKSFSAAAHGGGCPSARPVDFAAKPGAATGDAGQRPSELRQWPVQMHLVPPTAPFLQDAEVLLAADCVAFAYADFHKDMLQDKALLIGCPKLDDGQAYLQKLTDMLQHGSIRTLSVVVMEVPCCSGLVAIARQALAASGKEIPLEIITVGVQGDIKQ